MKTIVKEIDVIPKIIQYGPKSFIITDILDKSLLIKKCTFFISDQGIIEDIIIPMENKHPNCNPENGVVCKCFLHGSKYDENISPEHINGILGVYNFNSCYYKFWDKLKYKEM